MTGADFRARVLRAHGAGAGETEELLAYGAAVLHPSADVSAFPLEDEPFAAAWEGYAAEAAERGAWAVLRDRLPQLRFPVEPGIAETDAYRAATRRGEAVPAGTAGMRLREPGSLRLFVHPTPAGRLPVLVAGDRADFAALAAALAWRNEPRDVPASMGALMVAGFVNLDRVAALRRAWEAAHPGAGEEAWRARFREIAAEKALYQDAFVLLSEGPYSGVAASDLGLAEDEWQRASLAARLEHECAHYFSRRVFGAIRKTAWDEIVADYAGITAVAGSYRQAWALRFLGVEAHPAFRPGGRLANYRGTPPLSDGAFRVLRSLSHAAVRSLAAFDQARGGADRDPADRAATLSALFRLCLEEAAAEDGAERMLGVRQDAMRVRQDHLTPYIDIGASA